MTDSLASLIRCLPGARRVVRTARLVRRAARARYLQVRFPEGGFASCNGVRVYCRFDDEWYDGPSIPLAIDQAVVRQVLAQVGGDTFVDVGAHVGFSRYMSERLSRQSGAGAPQKKIVALEPDPTHFRLSSADTE